ncbi:hypothetical protein ACTPEF_26955, partial [Clostridioides difficile]
MINKYGKGLVKNSSILIGILVGYAISLVLGLVDFSAVQGAAITPTVKFIGLPNVCVPSPPAKFFIAVANSPSPIHAIIVPET